MQEEERLLLTQSIRAERAIEDAEDKLRALPLNAFMEQYGEQIEELWAKRDLHEAANRELAELTTEYKSQEIRLEQALRDIDPAWTRKGAGSVFIRFRARGGPAYQCGLCRV